jgi:hypothetical protein
VGIPASRGPIKDEYVSRVDIGGMNIFSLLFLDVSLILEFFTLLILRAFFARNACGSGAFANFVANLFGKCAFYPVFFPSYHWPPRPVRRFPNLQVKVFDAENRQSETIELAAA